MATVGVVWAEAAVAHMMASHGTTPAEADQALADPERVAQVPDPASRSGLSDRYIGWSALRGELLVVIVVRDGDDVYGANAWPANATAQHIYNERNVT